MHSDLTIIDLNFKNNLIDERLKENAFDSHKLFDLLQPSIIDKRTLQMIEIQDLYKAVDHTQTFIGSAKLFHSLMNPCESIELIHAKQDSLHELEGNDKLRNAIEEYLGVFSQGEPHLFKLLNAHMLPMFPYRDFNNAMDCAVKIRRAAENLPQPETQYLDSLIKNILSFGDSHNYALISKPAYRTFHGIRAKSEKKPLLAKLRFRPGRLSGGTLLPAAPSVIAGIAGLAGSIRPAVALSLMIFTCGGIIIGILYGAVAKPMFDYESAILPIRKRLYESDRFASAIEGIAALDELVSFMKYGKAVPHNTVIPHITNEESHFFEARGLKNPIRAKTEKDYVPNDVNLKNVGVTFITGPNSGGKTTYCKTIVQSQILGQIGAPVIADSAKINIADRIAYQAPAFDSLTDAEGRFGTELKITRDIFFSVTPKSLAILDEIAEGTTMHEKMSLSVDIMNAFYAKANNTLLVTHSYELVDKFKEQNKGQYLQVEFSGDKPTHRMIDGISRDSHALRVAKKVGFSPDDIKRHLSDHGYIPST